MKKPVYFKEKYSFLYHYYDLRNDINHPDYALIEEIDQRGWFIDRLMLWKSTEKSKTTHIIHTLEPKIFTGYDTAIYHIKLRLYDTYRISEFTLTESWEYISDIVCDKRPTKKMIQESVRIRRTLLNI